MDNNSPTKKKLIVYLKKQHPEVEDKDIPHLLSDIRRFVNVIQKIYTEPQARIYLKEINEHGKKVKKRFIDTNFEELLKIKRSSGEPVTGKTLRELTEKVLGVKYKKHGE